MQCHEYATNNIEQMQGVHKTKILNWDRQRKEMNRIESKTNKAQEDENSWCYI